MGWQSRADRDRDQALGEIQAQLLAARLTPEQALDRRQSVDRVHAVARRRARRAARRRAVVLACVGALGLTCGLSMALTRHDAQVQVAAATLGAIVLAIAAFREDRRLIRIVRTSAGPYVAGLLVDGPPIELEPREREATVMALEVKNLRALEEGLTLSDMADLSATLSDFFAGIGARFGAVTEPYRAGRVRLIFASGGATVGETGRGGGGGEGAEGGHTRRAVEAALAVQGELRGKDYKLAGPRAGVHVGIGVHSGPGILGAMGTIGPVPVTCLGPVADVAHELGAAATWDEVIVSDEIAQRLEGSLRAEAREPLYSTSQAGIVRIWAAHDLLPER